MPDCPKCGYALGPFDTACPRCARLGTGSDSQAGSSGQQEIDELLSSAKELSGAQDSPAPRKRPVSQARTPASPRRQFVLGAIAVAVILIGGTFLFLQVRGPGSGLGSNPLSEGPSPVRSSGPGQPAATGRRVPSGQPSSNQPAAETTQATEQEQADKDAQALLQQCPFDVRVGQEVAVKQAAQPADLRTSLKDGQLESLQCGAWTLRGSGGQALQVDQQNSGDAVAGTLSLRFLWKDQPFEVYQNGQLVGSFQNTDEYWQAQQ